MSTEHGIEVFDSNGRLVFTTKRKSVMIHAFGNVVISSGLNPTPVYFDPIDKLPELFIGNPGIFDIQPAAPMYQYIRSPMAGPFLKDGQGRYNRFEVYPEITARLPYQADIPGRTPLPWTIPYVVFY